MSKLVYGVGISDVTPFNPVWDHMLRRCYDPKQQIKQPTYKGCTVCEKWLTASNFQRWFEQHWKPGLYLDKDIIKPGNKVYCPEFCCFVTRALNNLLLDRGYARGKWPVGVHLHCRAKKFQAECKVNGRSKHLGYFLTPEEAHAAYVKFKSNHIRGIAAEQTDLRIASGLCEHARLLEDQCHLK